MKVLLLIILFVETISQQATMGAGTSYNATAVSSISVIPDPASPYNPNDFYRKVEVSITNIYLLASNNIVQVYSKFYPNTLVQIFNTYSFTNISPYEFVDMFVSQDESLAVITSYSGGTLQHLLFSVTPLGVGPLLNITGITSISTPDSIFIEGSSIFTYIKGSGPNNDSFYIVDILTNTSSTKTLTTKNCQIKVTPDGKKALLWDQNSKVYIYLASAGMPLDYTFLGNQVSPSGKTNSIAISSDSQLAIIESDNHSPVNVLNLTDYSVANSFSTGGGKVEGAGFVGGDSRFIYLEKNNKNKFYDTVTDTLVDYNGPSIGTDFQVDSQSAEIYSVGSSNLNIYGMELMVDNSVVMDYLVSSAPPPPPASNSTNSTNSTNTTNSTAPVNSTNSTSPANSTDTTNTTNSTAPVNSTNQTNLTSPQILSEQFYQEVQFTSMQNETVETISSGLKQVNVVVQKSFSIIFSSPLAIFFLSLFSYFNLASMYVLLDVKLPKIIFEYLSELFKSCSVDFLNQAGFTWRMQPWAEQRVHQNRALYFQVTSDLLPEHFNEIIMYLSNFILIQSLIFLSGKCHRFSKLSRTLAHYRGDIYLGLLISGGIELLLPWKFSFYGSYQTRESKITIGVQYILLYLLPFFGIATLMDEIKNTKQKDKKHMMIALQNWWPIYEMLVFPIVVMIGNPIYFMSIIGVSFLCSFYTSFFVLKWKLSAIVKVAYQIILHGCFFIFIFVTNSKILANTSIIYLSVLLLGAVHHLVQSIVVIVRFVIKAVKKYCSGLKVEPKNQEVIENVVKPEEKRRGEQSKNKIQEKSKSKKKKKSISSKRKKTKSKNKQKEKTDKTVTFTIFKSPDDWRIRMDVQQRNNQMIRPTKKNTTVLVVEQKRKTKKPRDCQDGSHLKMIKHETEPQRKSRFND